MTLADELLALAHAVGEPRRQLAILAEGNVSARIDDDRMLVKATGSSMATATAADVVECRLAPILELLDDPRAFEGGDGDARVGEVLLASRVDVTAKRPSVEALLHAVVLSSGASAACHTHPVSANGILCSDRASLLAAGALFPDQIVVLGPRTLLVPYVDPGLGLGRRMRDELRVFADEHGALPKLVWLQSHGIFAIGDDPAECLRITEMADKVARVLTATLAVGEPAFLPDAVVDRIDGRDDEDVRRAALASR